MGCARAALGLPLSLIRILSRRRWDEGRLPAIRPLREGGCGTLSLSSKTTRALPLLSSQRPPQPPAVFLLSQQLHPRPEMSLSLRSGVRGGGTIVSLTDSYVLPFIKIIYCIFRYHSDSLANGNMVSSPI